MSTQYEYDVTLYRRQSTQQWHPLIRRLRKELRLMFFGEKFMLPRFSYDRSDDTELEFHFKIGVRGQDELDFEQIIEDIKADLPDYRIKVYAYCLENPPTWEAGDEGFDDELEEDDERDDEKWPDTSRC